MYGDGDTMEIALIDHMQAFLKLRYNLLNDADVYVLLASPAIFC